VGKPKIFFVVDYDSSSSDRIPQKVRKSVPICYNIKNEHLFYLGGVYKERNESFWTLDCGFDFQR